MTLNSREILHIAMDSAARGDHLSAIKCLKEGLAQDDTDARLWYFLGAEHAQIALFEDAEKEIGKAVHLDPGMHVAVFQLGLLQMTQGKMVEAMASWVGLDGLPKDNALAHFRFGLEALAVDDFVGARAFLEKGIAANSSSEPLNQDMTQIIGRINDHLNSAESKQSDSDANTKQFVAFTAYDNHLNSD